MNKKESQIQLLRYGEARDLGQVLTKFQKDHVSDGWSTYPGEKIEVTCYSFDAVIV